MIFHYEEPRLIDLSSAQRMEFIHKFEVAFGKPFPCTIPDDCHHITANYVGHWTSLVSPAADAELITAALGGEELDRWPELPDPFFATAMGEGSNIGYLWFVQRQGTRYLWFQEIYYHAYNTKVSFEACYKALLRTLQAFNGEPNRSGYYFHELGETGWEDPAHEEDKS